MSQVHIRQVPFSTSTDAQRIVGSWFPTSYYGNFRAKSRADLAQYFRQLAQPIPPKKFVDRQTVEANTHVFSQHDNRFRFECDPLVRNTQGGFGRRKTVNSARGNFNPYLISWVPRNTDHKALAESVKITSYGDDYNRDTAPSRILAEIQTINNTDDKNTPSPITSTASVYSCTYKHGQPDQERSKQIRQETFQRFLSARTQMSKQKSNKRSGNGDGSVAACMVWNNTDDENKSIRPSLPPSTSVPPPKDEIITIVKPITLQPRTIVDTNSSSISGRQRAQSAGPRLVTSVSKQSLPLSPPLPTQKTVSNPPIQISQTISPPRERPRTALTTSREHYTGCNFGPKITDPRPTAPYEQTYTNRMQNLISKYM
ncbi:unnamed protein product [Adineta ricciae]|uniref:Domain of unknown function with conserved HDNR motif domain-containing protein n=1 Tax=Adineta ricciae TaxID=249248 RepID=A0A814KAR2_ADIRI|nr:unnamed protein product [Adineta ricciae]